MSQTTGPTSLYRAVQQRAVDLEEALRDMVDQFAYTTVKDGVLCLTDGGLSALEGAFAVLGWESPKPIPDRECQIEGCHQEATCGTPTPDGYKRLCSEHFGEQQAAMNDAKCFGVFDNQLCAQCWRFCAEPSGPTEWVQGNPRSIRGLWHCKFYRRK